MPLIERSDYRAPWWLPGGHVQTIWPTLCRSVPGIAYEREALHLPDGDVLALDWLRAGRRRLVVLSHGLEGHSRRAYVMGMARAFRQAGWDALAWNFRDSGGMANRLPKFTTNHSSEDLAAVVDHAVAGGRYDRVVLVGFSMGGNLTLLYLGRHADAVPACVDGAVVFSVPVHAPSAGARLDHPVNALYRRRFLVGLGRRMARLNRSHPGLISLAGYGRTRTLAEFDDRFTAPLHGFASGADYWAACNSRPCLRRIRVPTLLVNAENDPILTPECFPTAEARESRWLFLETPSAGGHCGFTGGPGPSLWSEHRAVAFAEAADGAAATAAG